MIRATAILAVTCALAIAATAQAKPKPKPAAAPPPVAEQAPAPPPPPPPPPPPTLKDLAGGDEALVRTKLGAPDIARREGAGGLWTYRFKGCALFVYFRAEDGQGLRVSGASAGPRRRGQKPPAVDDCIAQFKDRGDPAGADDPIQAILDLPGAETPK